MNVLLVYPDRESHLHWMNKRLMKRGGFQLEEFDVAYAWQDDLYAQLGRHKVAVAMGLQPLRVLMGAYQPFRWLGKFTTHATGCVVVGGFDPLRLLPNYVEDDDDDEDAGEERTRSPARLTAAVAMAIRKAQRINALSENPYLVETHYTYDPSPDEFARWVDACLGANPEYLSWDIETNFVSGKDETDLERATNTQDVIRISFAYEVGRAVSIPWEPAYLSDIRRLFSDYSGWHVGWNSYGFDLPLLMEKGFTFGGKFLDGMDAWHWLQSDLDKGLEHVTGFFTDILPWKHLSKSEPQHYSCLDADAALRNTIAIVGLIKESGSWDSYQVASVDLMMPHLYPAGRRGNFIDRQSQETLRAELTAKLDDLLWEIQGVVPEEFKTYKQYTRQPTGDGWEPQEGVGEERVCSKCGKTNVNVKHPCVKSGEGQIEKRVVSKTYWIQKTPPKGMLRKWIQSNGFNPNSSDQLRRYIRAQGHPLGKNHKNKNADEAVDAKHLKRLARSYPDHKVYALIVATHKVLKALSTYVEGLTPDDTGRVYTTYRNNPSTWRLCIAKGTLVDTVRGRVPIEDVQEGDTVYTFDDEGQLTLRPVKWVGKTGTKSVVRVEWQAGYGPSTFMGHVDMTADHRVRLVDGTYKQAKDLTPLVRRGSRVRGKGDRVLAIHRGVNQFGYEKIYYTNGPRNGELNHRFVCRVTGQDIEDKHVHHKDGNKLNNRPDNLEVLDAALHGGITGAANGKMKSGAFRDHLRQHLEATAYEYAVSWCGYAPHNHVITSVTPLDGKVDVYDLEVEGTKNFIAGELCVHNSSEAVNMQNQGKRSDNPYAKKARKTIIASPGHVLVQADSSGIEAVMVGHFMQDAHYMDLARQSIHAYLVCKWHGWEWNPANLKRAKSDPFYDMMKRTVHGTNYGMGYRLLFNTYDETFKSMSDAKRCQEFLFAQLSTLEQWQHEVRVRAQKECYLQSPWGHRHYFYDVFSYRLSPTGKVMYGPTGRPLIRLGKDSKRAIAYLPQHSAGMFMRENLGIIGRSEFGRYMPANVSVHDGYVLDVPKVLAGSAADFLSEVLTRPIPQMGNLRVGCEVEQGENWLELEKVRTVTV